VKPQHASSVRPNGSWRPKPINRSQPVTTRRQDQRQVDEGFEKALAHEPLAGEQPSRGDAERQS
jgi:hypothetical protein